MSDVRALAEHTCPACGAAAEWNPTRGALACPYCGTVVPTETDEATGEVREIPLAQALREVADEDRGWQAARRTVRCNSCSAVSVLDASTVGGRCAFCGSPELVGYEEIRSPIRPRSLLPFTVDRTKATEAIKAWWKKRWLAPRALSRRALVDEVQGIYVPYWTFDAAVEADWRADSGTYYYTTETYRGSDGKTHTRQKRHTRWRPAAGHVSHFFDDELVCGSRGIHADLLRGAEPFPTETLIPYDTAYLSGFTVEHYQVVLVEAANQGRTEMEAKLRSMCAGQIPGDTYRNLQVAADWQGETFKHVLLPVWVVSYDYGKRAFQVVVNGVTGTVAGESPQSVWKIVGLVLAALAVVAALVLFLNAA